jgi:hypothetical protein
MAKDTAPPPYGTYEKKSEAWVKHSEYYLDEGNLFILVYLACIVIDGNLYSSMFR